MSLSPGAQIPSLQVEQVTASQQTLPTPASTGKDGTPLATGSKISTTDQILLLSYRSATDLTKGADLFVRMTGSALKRGLAFADCAFPSPGSTFLSSRRSISRTGLQLPRLPFCDLRVERVTASISGKSTIDYLKRAVASTVYTEKAVSVFGILLKVLMLAPYLRVSSLIDRQETGRTA